MSRWLVVLTILFRLSLSTADAASNAITVGTLRYNPPFEVVSSPYMLFGFEIDIMNSVCAHAQLSCTFKPFFYSELLTQITQGSINLAIATIIISKYTQQNFIFSKPYLQSSGQFFVKKNSSINTLADLKGKVIGTVDDPLFEAYLGEKYSENNAVIYQGYTSLEPALSDLQEGKIDVFFLDKIAINYWIANNNQQFKSVGPVIPLGFGYAIAANKDNAALINLVNSALSAMEKDGSYLAIYNKYFSV